MSQDEIFEEIQRECAEIERSSVSPKARKQKVRWCLWLTGLILLYFVIYESYFGYNNLFVGFTRTFIVKTIVCLQSQCHHDVEISVFVVSAGSHEYL